MEDFICFHLQPINLDSLECMLLAKICSYLDTKDVLCKIPTICKQLNSTIKTDTNFVKALNAQKYKHYQYLSEKYQYSYERKDKERCQELLMKMGQFDTILFNQHLLNQLKINSGSRDLYKAIKLLKVNSEKANNRDLELIPLNSSSKDYNQSVHRTVNRRDTDQFWSSGGTKQGDSNEWLTYKIPINTNGEQKSSLVKGCALITKFIIQVFNPDRLQNVNHSYAPRAVQIQISNHSSFQNITYTSKTFDVDQKSNAFQMFDVRPDLCTGRFIRVNLLGQPHKQPMDDQYYVALTYFGVEGIPFDQLVLDDSPTSPSDLHHTPTSPFPLRFQNILLNQVTEIDQDQQLNILKRDNYQMNIRIQLSQMKGKSKDSSHRKLKNEYLFEHREQVLVQLSELLEEKVIDEDDIGCLFKYALVEMGISGYVISKIILLYFVRLSYSSDCNKLLASFSKNHLNSIIHLQSSGLFTNLKQEDVHDITKGKYKNVLNMNFKKILLTILQLDYELAYMEIVDKSVIPELVPQHSLFILYRVLQKRYTQGKSLDIESYARLHLQRFGYTRLQLQELMKYLNFDQELLQKFEKEIEQNEAKKKEKEAEK